MRTKDFALIVFAILFLVSPAIAAGPQSDERGYIGIKLDSKPLPDLLTKHLGLSPDQGIRISNVKRDSPADQAGLERDDIIIGFQGQDVTDYEEFIKAVQETSVDTEVSLQIIHLGARKTVKLKLARLTNDYDWKDWKYPPEPQGMQWWSPGRIFRLKPGGKDWIEMFLTEPEPEFDLTLRRFFKELYYYHHCEDGEKYSITIEGNPDDEATKITVEVGDNEYKTTVKQIDKLPKKYRAVVKEDLENARKYSCKKRRIEIFAPSPPAPEAWRHYFEQVQPHLPPYPALPQPGFDRKILDRIEKQMQELSRRIEELEKRNKQLLQRFHNELKKQQSQQKKESIRRGREDDQRV